MPAAMAAGIDADDGPNDVSPFPSPPAFHGHFVADSISTPAPAGTVRWFHLLLLAALLAGGTTVRFYRLSDDSLWLDEYWSLYLSTGRGQAASSIFDAPSGVVLDPPPPTGFHDAPPWWRIWTGMRSAVHPPLYHIVLRWWVDIFGDGDFSVRTLSALLGLAGAALLFEIVCRHHGPWPALLAASLMLFSVAQIDLSREARSYTMLVVLGLVCCRAVLFIEQKGVSWPRLIVLGAAAAAMALTHYFAVGCLAGLALYGLICFRGHRRTAMLAALLVAAVVVAATWGPFFWASRHLLHEQGDYPLHGATAQIFSRLSILPTRLVLSPLHVSWMATFSLAILVLLAPVLFPRRTPQVLMWWLWMLGGVGFILAFDLARQTLMVSIFKLLLPAGAGMYALVAIQPPPGSRFARWRAPAFIFLCVGAIWSIFEKQFDLNQLVSPDRVGLVYIVLLPLAVVAIVAGSKRSWRIWAMAAGATTIALNFALLATAHLSATVAITLILFTYLFFLITAPRERCAWLAPMGGGALALWSIFTACQWTAAGSVIVPIADWRTVSALIDQNAAADDLVAFTVCKESNPVFCYIVFKHYAPDSHRPVIFLGDQPPSPATSSAMARRQCVWVVGGDPQADSSRYFPGWHIGPVLSVPNNCNIWPVYPPSGQTR